jgi:hypothetical protein
VPQQSREYKRLGKWVNTQRTRNKRGKVLPARKQLLDSIGFIWVAQNVRANQESPNQIDLLEAK